ncbi:MAG: hypothetical protein V1867_07415 [Candidatus Falkowbacteria bacterium]
MPITPEQFKYIATKEDLVDLEEKIDRKMDQKIDKVLTAIDGLAKEVKDSRIEKLSNQVAHDRMQGDLVKIKEHVGLKV